MSLQQIKAIAFDLDGTLVDSITDLTIAANEMRKHLNMAALAPEILKSYVGDGLAQLVHRALTNSKNQAADDTLWQQGFLFFLRYYKDNLTNHTQIYPQIEDLLPLLKTLGYPLAVITNKNELFAYQILKNLNLIDYFSIIIGGDTLTEKKPAALPLLHVATSFNIKPEELAMVGDSLNDFKAANNAGAVAIGVNYGYQPNLEQEVKKLNLNYAFITPHAGEIYHRFKDAKL